MKLKTLFTNLSRYANKQTRDMRSLRRLGISMYTSALRGIMLPPPKILINGPAKSGTHLLSDCLSLMPNMMFSGRHFALSEFMVSLPDGSRTTRSADGRHQADLDVMRLERFLKRCPQGMFVTAHARFHPLLAHLLEELRFRQLILLRDPRDVVISSVFSSLKRQPWHPAHRFFFQVLKDDEERIMVSIRGLQNEHSPQDARGSIRRVFEGYMAWLNEPSTLMVRFEDLVGPRGGGDIEKQLATIERIGDFIDRPLDRAGAMAIARTTYGTTGLTFRKGAIGDWSNHFTEEHRNAFKDIAGDILISLGYERDNTW